ncbi:RING finger protein [Coemansia reversa NRRL 1564]|uniref:RING finger protein n=1 Tax=Coemansia reversa (strain ATCC 12441 / NRRL 1564) TaxID=763665 RepID=A0A2G5B472_COERN|nr:RING finger protein [Coemansia reversa NRRL 1564]|eukprot:PIA13791.1 RING finger protein [Coemansia reversa NRRL 1564]
MDSAARPLVAAEGGPVGSDGIDIAAVNEAQRRAQVSMLFSGRSPSEDEIRLALEREAFKAEHKGHEKKHFVMFLIFVAVLAMLPPTVRYWRRRHPVSYRLASIGSICLIPPYFALANQYFRFVTIWLIYAAANTYILYLATRTPLYPRTPRRIYQWFALTNKVSYMIFLIGMVLFCFCFFNAVPGLTDTELFVENSMLTVFYGLYFGLVSRDLVALCSEKMAATLGYAVSNGLPTKYLPHGVCCICGDELGNTSSRSNNSDRNSMSFEHIGEPSSSMTKEAPMEPTHKLECEHEFHACCIRGWCVVGKKDTCPFCLEKVNLAMFKRNPWDKQEMHYVSALEYMRFLVGWQPLVLMLLAGVFWVLGLE